MGWLCGSAPKEVVQSTASKKPDAAEAASSAAAPAPAESKVKVYGLALSTCTRRVLNALEEKGVPYELVIVDLFKGGNKEADYLAKQPFAQIPALEDGDVRIFESRAIVRYIANKWASQGTDLWGKDAQTIANTDTWMEVEKCHFDPPAGSLIYERFAKELFGAGPCDEAVVEAQLVKLNTVLDVYEALLSKQAYLGGSEVSMADLSHLPAYAYLVKSKVTEPFDSRPAVKAWIEKLAARPSWTKLTAE